MINNKMILQNCKINKKKINSMNKIIEKIFKIIETSYI